MGMNMRCGIRPWALLAGAGMLALTLGCRTVSSKTELPVPYVPAPPDKPSPATDPWRSELPRRHPLAGERAGTACPEPDPARVDGARDLLCAHS